MESRTHISRSEIGLRRGYWGITQACLQSRNPPRRTTGSHVWLRKSLICKYSRAEYVLRGGRINLIVFPRPVEVLVTSRGRILDK